VGKTEIHCLHTDGPVSTDRHAGDYF